MLITNPNELEIEYAHLNLSKDVFNTADKFFKDNALVRKTKEDYENPDIHLLKCLMDIDNVYFLAKWIFNIELHPFQVLIQQELFNHKFPILIGTRGLSKTFNLSLYAMIKSILNQGSKVVVVGAGLRQSKQLFNYCEKFWYQSGVLRSLFNAYQGKPAGPKVSNDRYLFNLGDSTITFLPVGDGSKIRGERASVLILDEFACVDRDTLIETPNGLKRISDEDCKNLNVEVINRHGDLEKPAAYNITPKTDVYEVRFGNGLRTKCSNIHMFWTKDGVWKECQQLKPKVDVVCAENHYVWPTTDSINNNKLAEAFGYFYNIGATITKDYITFKAWERFRPLFEILKELGVELKNADNNLVVIDNVWGLESGDKLPNIILSCTKESFSHFLRGICRTGTVEERLGIPTFRVGIGDRPRLIQDLIVMAYKFGVTSLSESKGNAATYWAFVVRPALRDFLERKTRKLDFDKLFVKKQWLKVLEVKKLDYKDHLYDFYLPSTNSFYGDGIVQHNTIPPDIYENVIAGFAAVSANPVESAKRAARKKIYKERGIDFGVSDGPKDIGNQTILSGTASYEFNHFAKYWKKYKTIIETKGDEEKIKAIFNSEEIPKSFDYKDYSIIRIPHYLLPEDFMDEGQVARSKANVHTGIFNMEFCGIFSKDSEGFFKRSLIETCVFKNEPIITSSGVAVNPFDASLYGNPNAKYIYGIDPAAVNDNFCIVVLECGQDYRKIVYAWTVNKKEFQQKLADGYAKKDDYYGYCARKVRDLMKVFPCDAIAIDSQGGGIAISEALHDEDKMEGDELRLWPIIEQDKEKYSDDQEGLHILHMINFADAKWVVEANHGMKKDLEDRVLLFPRFNTAILAEAIGLDELEGKVKYDTIEDCLFDIEELKNEMSIIIHTQTGTAGRDHWDTPEVKVAGSKKGRLRKDRYSALLMANMVARTEVRAIKNEGSFDMVGGFAQSFIGATSKESSGKMPKWLSTGWDQSVIIV